MKKMIYILIFVLLGISQVFAARVTNVELSYLDGNTVAKIYVDGKIRFVHQTEEPKDGKPYRAIVDILAATHNLGQQNFDELPDCLVENIRSSQYSVKPEEVVRVVFDLKESVIYRVSADNSAITIFFQDNKTKSFAPWSTVKYIANPEENKPEQAKPAPVTTVAQTTEKTTPPVTAVLTESEPKTDLPTEKITSVKAVAVSPTFTQHTEKTETPEPVKAANPEIKIKQVTPEAEKSAPVIKETVKDIPTAKAQVETSPSPKENALIFDEPSEEEQHDKIMPVKKEKEISPTSDDKPISYKSKAQYPLVPKTSEPKMNNVTVPETSVPESSVIREGKPETAKSVLPDTKQDPVNQNQEIEKNDTTAPVNAPKIEDEKDESSTSSTSRFRRSPTRPTKIKGTLVAEFPQRLVVKYSAKSYRDPFETLINDSRTYDSPIQQRIANVEGLKLVGVIESGSGNRALFEDNEGYSYILKSGDKVKKGYVLRVEYDRVYFQIFEYGWSRTVALQIEEY